MFQFKLEQMLSLSSKRLYFQAEDPLGDVPTEFYLDLPDLVPLNSLRTSAKGKCSSKNQRKSKKLVKQPSDLVLVDDETHGFHSTESMAGVACLSLPPPSP